MRAFWFMKRSVEIIATTIVTLVVMSILVNIIAEERGGAAEAAAGSYSAMAVTIIKLFIVIGLAALAVVGIIAAVLGR